MFGVELICEANEDIAVVAEVEAVYEFGPSVRYLVDMCILARVSAKGSGLVRVMKHLLKLCNIHELDEHGLILGQLWFESQTLDEFPF